MNQFHRELESMSIRRTLAEKEDSKKKEWRFRRDGTILFKVPSISLSRLSYLPPYSNSNFFPLRAMKSQNSYNFTALSFHVPSINSSSSLLSKCFSPFTILFLILSIPLVGTIRILWLFCISPFIYINTFQFSLEITYHVDLFQIFEEVIWMTIKSDLKYIRCNNMCL